MSIDRVALLIDPKNALIATRDKLTLIRGSNQNELIRMMYTVAPDVKAVYFFTMVMDHANINAAIASLKAVGYSNIKLVNNISWLNTEMLHRSSVECEVGECIATIYTITGEEMPFIVYEKTDDGYVEVGDQRSCEISHFSKFLKLKNIIILTLGHDFSDYEKARMKNMFPRQTVQFVSSKGRNWLKCIWDDYDGKVQNFLPVSFTLNLRFKFGNTFHLETVHYSKLPFEKALDLDIDNANYLTVSAHYNNNDEGNKLKTYKFPAGKSRTLRIELKVGHEFLPEVVVTVANEVDTVDGVVYSINFDCDSELFTATMIKADGSDDVTASKNVSNVLEQLNEKKASAKLRGVFIDYPGHVEFPLDAHRQVIEALPSPTTKVCIGRTHSEWAIHLWHSGVKVKVGEHVVIANWITYHVPYKEYFSFLKTPKGFRVVGKHREELPDVPFSTIVVIVKHIDCGYEELAQRLFPSKRVVFSERWKLPTNALHDFAWQYFNGLDFHDCMVEPYRGIFFVARSGDHCDFVEKSCIFNCGTYECNFASLLEKMENHENDPFYSKFYVFLSYVGYKEEVTVLEIPIPKTDFIHLKLQLDKHFIPTATFTEADSPALKFDKTTGLWDVEKVICL